MADQVRDVVVETPDGPMRLYEAAPPGPPRGALIVVQEAFGVNPHIESVTRRAAAAGYLAVAPDFFHRSGPGAVVDYDNFAGVMEHFGKIGSDKSVLTDVGVAIKYLRGAEFTDREIGIVGFCFGGRVTFLTALHYRLGAAVGFYGGGIVKARIPQFPALVGEVAALATPWLGLFGDEDASIPVDDVEELRAALRSAPVDADIVRYPAAGHGFHCDARDAYRADDAADAWKRALDWFASHIA